MKLEEAIKQKDKIFQTPAGFYCDTVVKDMRQYIWAIKLLYGNGYEVRKKEK